MDDKTHPSREAFIHEQRRWALAISKAILHGRLGPTEGARLMVHVRGNLGLLDDEEFNLLRIFIGLESETDDLPVGAEHQRFVQRLSPLVPDEVEELDVVETLEEIVGEGFYAPQGATGTVVHVHLTPSLAYLVEFADENGVTLALPTLLPAQVRVVWKATST